MGHAIELFKLADGTGSFRVSTDSAGAYSVLARIYTGNWDVKPLTVRAGQHLVLDLTTHALSQ